MGDDMAGESQNRVHEFVGRVWMLPHKDPTQGYDNIDTDQIIPAAYLTSFDMNFLKQYAFSTVHPNFVPDVSKFVRESGASAILVEGKNFGKGSSREHAPRALKGLGVSCVVAKSFARIYRENSIFNGFPPIIQPNVVAESGDLAIVSYEEEKGGTVSTFAPESQIEDLAKYLSVRKVDSEEEMLMEFEAKGGERRSVTYKKRGSWNFEPLEDPLLEKIMWAGGLASYKKGQILAQREKIETQT